MLLIYGNNKLGRGNSAFNVVEFDDKYICAASGEKSIRYFLGLEH